MNRPLSTVDAAKILESTDQTIRDWIERGWLHASRVGRRWIFTLDDLERAVDAQQADHVSKLRVLRDRIAAARSDAA
jgi:excisionase family DNA binding protein